MPLQATELARQMNQYMALHKIIWKVAWKACLLNVSQLALEGSAIRPVLNSRESTYRSEVSKRFEYDTIATGYLEFLVSRFFPIP